MIIAIDGPAASGKSTTAKRVAETLNLLYIDTGAMYRAATLIALQKKISLTNETDVLSAVRSSEITQKNISNTTKTFIDGVDVSDTIRSREVTSNVSQVAAFPSVRAVLVDQQKSMGKNGNVILDGRDIGTVVFPNADLKIFMIATAEERAKRRLKEFEEKGETLSLSEVIEDIKRRDKLDAEREASPLKKAEDAVEIDTSLCTIDEQVERIVKLVNEQKQN